MSWRDNLRSASFASGDITARTTADPRGITAFFQVLSSKTEFGRRNIFHQFPFNDIPLVEDIGEDLEKFTLDCFVVQTPSNDFDYYTERDLLIKALKQRGTGTLIHPYLGELVVAVTGNVSMEESAAEGGIARFKVTFTRATADPRGITEGRITTVNPVGEVDRVALASMETFGSTFVDSHDIGIFPSAYPRALETSFLDNALSSIDMVQNAVATGIGFVSTNISAVLGVIATIRATIDTVIAIPDTLRATLQQAVLAFTNLIGLTNNQIAAISGIPSPIGLDQIVSTTASLISPTLTVPVVENLYTSTVTGVLDITRFGETQEDIDGGIVGGTSQGDTPSPFGGVIDAVTVDTENTAREEGNNKALVNLIRNTAVAASAMIAIRANYSSEDEATEIMVKVVDVLDFQLIKLGNETFDPTLVDLGVIVDNDADYQALQNLRSTFVDNMITLGASLDGLETITVPNDVTSSLVLAYDRYNDLNKSADIEYRNRTLVNHPGFLPSGDEIEVLRG